MSDEQETAPEVTWPRVFKLKHPFSVGSEHITEITLRRGKLGDTKGIKLGGDIPIEQLHLLACRLSGKTIKVIEELDAEDAGEIMEAVTDFLGKCLSAGKTR